MASTGRPEADVHSPLVATAALLGRKWHPVIVRRLLADGPLGFNALASRIRGISRKVLSESLSDLQEKDVVRRRVLQETPTRVEYSLTDRGQALDRVVDELHRWGEAYLAETREEQNPGVKTAGTPERATEAD